MFSLIKKYPAEIHCAMIPSPPSSSNMATKKTEIISKVSKVSKEMNKLNKMKVTERVYEVLEQDLKSKKRSLDKQLWRIKSKQKKMKFGSKKKEVSKPPNCPKVKIQLK